MSHYMTSFKIKRTGCLILKWYIINNENRQKTCTYILEYWMIFLVFKTLNCCYRSSERVIHNVFRLFFAVYNISFQYETPCRTFFHYYFFAQTDHFIYLTSFFFKKWLLPTNRKKNHKNPEASQTGKIK